MKTQKVPSLQAVSMEENGMIKGRDKDGNPIKAKILGRSLASRVREEYEEQQKRDNEPEYKNRSEARQRRRQRRANKQ